MSERWKPGKREIYFYVGRDFEAYNAIWLEDFPEKNRWQKGNCFKTEAEAQAAAEKVKALLLSLHEPTTECSQSVTNSSQLPKLTTEVFDRPDCPEWAKYAAVDAACLAYWYQYPPIADERVGAWAYSNNKRQLIDQYFNRSNWQNSLVERPAKLPDWCKVGQWVYHDSDGYYYTVKSVDIENDNIQIRDEESEYTYTANEIKTFFSEARLRPYTADEMQELVGKVIESKYSAHLIYAFDKTTKKIETPYEFFDAQLLLDSCFTINGKPCGIFEHLNENGEWVE